MIMTFESLEQDCVEPTSVYHFPKGKEKEVPVIVLWYDL